MSILERHTGQPVGIAATLSAHGTQIRECPYGTRTTSCRGATRQPSQKVVDCVDVVSAASLDDDLGSVCCCCWSPLTPLSSLVVSASITCRYAEAVAYGAHGTKELQFRVRTGVIARNARLYARVDQQVAFLRPFSSPSFSSPPVFFVRHFQVVHFQRLRFVLHRMLAFHRVKVDME